MRLGFADTVTELLDERDDTAIVLADISVRHFGDASERHPSRVINVGIREQLMISATAGLALAGMRPIAHTYAPFLTQRAYEQIKLDLSHNDVGAVLASIGSSFDASKEGRTHLAPEDVSLFDGFPGWNVFVPGHPIEASHLLRAAVRREDRTYVRLSEVQQNASPLSVGIGEATVLRKGTRGVVLAVGPTLDAVLQATQGMDLTVAYTASVRPLDTSVFTHPSTEANFIVVEPYLEGTSGSVVAKALSHRPHRLLSIGVPNRELRKYGYPQEHIKAAGLDAAGIRRRIGTFMASTPRRSRRRDVQPLPEAIQAAPARELFMPRSSLEPL